MSDLDAILETGAAAAVEIAAAAVAERGGEIHPCPNCGKPMIGAYCAVCGQERDTHRRSVWGLVHALVEDIISFDSRILRTIVALLVEPGEIAIAFREGRTRRYVPALRLYFFVSLFFFLILSVTGLAILQLEVTATTEKIIFDAKGNAFVKNPAYDPADPDMTGQKPLIALPGVKGKGLDKHYSFSTRAHFFAPVGLYRSVLTKDERDKLVNPDFEVQTDDKASTPAQRQAAAEKKKQIKSWIEKNVFDGIRRLENDPAALNGPLTTWIPRALFLLMPLYALLLVGFYWRRRKDFYFVDHLIFSLTIHTFIFVVLIVDAGLAQLLSGGTVAWLTCAAIGLYTFIAMKRFYRQGWFTTALKFATVSFIYTCFFLLPALGAVMAVSFLGGQID